MADFNPPLTVRNCGNPEHGPKWACHRVTDATGRILLLSVDRGTAETFASVASLRAQVQTLTAAQDALREAHAAEVAMLRAERDGAIESLRGARGTLKALAPELSEHAYQELACHLDDEPGGSDGARITTQADELRARVAELEKERDAAQQRAQARSDVLTMLVRRHDEWDDADCWCEHKRSGPHALHGKACREARATMGITTEAP